MIFERITVLNLTRTLDFCVKLYEELLSSRLGLRVKHHGPLAAPLQGAEGDRVVLVWVMVHCLQALQVEVLQRHRLREAAARQQPDEQVLVRAQL
jgi:hypothetical protein